MGIMELGLLVVSTAIREQGYHSFKVLKFKDANKISKRINGIPFDAPQRGHNKL